MSTWLGSLGRQKESDQAKVESAALLTRYKQLRQVGLELNNKLVRTLSKSEIDEGGKALGILRKNVLVLDTQDQIAVLMDFCLHDVRRGGKNAIESYLANSPPPLDSDEMVLLQAKRQARFGLFMVEAVEPGLGVQVRDLLEGHPIFLVDVGFSNTASPGMLLAARIMKADDIAMTTGAAQPVG